MDNFDKLREPIGNNDFDCILCLGSYISESCKKYALSNMTDEDYILLQDANRIKTNDIMIFKDDSSGRKKPYTLKKSSALKYDDFYSKKLIQIMERLSK